MLSFRHGLQSPDIGDPDFGCPSCGGHDYSVVVTRGLYQCSTCRLQTSLRAGTIFHSSKLPLTTWFLAMFLLTKSKHGISSIELGRDLGVSQARNDEGPFRVYRSRFS